MLDWRYCQIYCQKRGGEGIPGDGKHQDFSNLLISIGAYVGSTKSPGAILDARSAPAGRGPGWPESIPPSPPLNF
jgi:hypothetical protein